MHRSPRRNLRRGTALLAMSAMVGTLSGWAVAAPRPAERARATAPTDPGSPTRPAGLPAFGIGLHAHPDETGIYGWMPDSGVPWDYAYQYLTGGVNTGKGWSFWNKEAQFPLWYAQGAEAEGYLPVFTYFTLIHSDGPCAECKGALRDFVNLNDASLMRAYFADFKLAMKRLGPGTHDGIKGYGGTVIVHVEPDLSGYVNRAVLTGNCYGFCSGQGNNPELLSAAVGSSGDPDVRGYADNYQGYSLALAHLRDLYAPNVLLGFHVSNWATGQDVGDNPNPRLDPVRLGRRAGAFAARSGVQEVRPDTTTYDLIFNDVLDRDAGYYKYELGDDRWWDRLNVTFPNFHRWESYVKSFSDTAGRSTIVWQIPEGNQRYRTSANVPGHYQDNRAEYFFSNIQELEDSRIIAILFGAGQRGQTQHWDDARDGITNPPSFCTTDGISSGQLCNTQSAVYSDDDGGLIRLEGEKFYKVGAFGAGGHGERRPK